MHRLNRFLMCTTSRCYKPEPKSTCQSLEKGLSHQPGCPVILQGWAMNDTVKEGFIQINQQVVYRWTGAAGLYVAQLEPLSCKVQDVYR